jgi:response regulator NasT
MDISEMLHDAGFQVLAQGSDGLDAVELCKQYKPDVLLMDVKMPVFDGLSAAETILHNDMDVCIVLITAYNDNDFIEKAKEIGVSAYLVKPVEERNILPALEIAIAQSKRYSAALGDIRDMKRQLEDKKLIDRAKLIIAKRDGITEGEAYAMLRQLSMNRRCSMASIASMIVASGSPRGTIDKAKKWLMDELHLNEDAAYRKIKDYSQSNACTMEQASIKILSSQAVK